MSSQPTSLYSDYITGPGTISDNQTSSATVSATASASVTAEAGIVFAKASTTMGVAVTGGKTWTQGFSYAMAVAAGEHRRMHLLEESRVFNVSKYRFDTGTCSFLLVYSDRPDAPRSESAGSWVLET